MSALTDLLAARTELTASQIEHVQRLVADWQLLSDLSFADLLLWVRLADGTFLCAAQCRPTTAPTAYLHDLVGHTLDAAEARTIEVAWSEGRIVSAGEADWDGDVPIRREGVPVRTGEAVVAVLGRDSNLASVRSPSQLELVYLQTAADLAGMVADGSFPAPQSVFEDGAGPRVGDGLLRLERDGTVIYASPNASSALRRLGVSGNVLGEQIGSLTGGLSGPLDSGDLAQAVADAVAGSHPVGFELDSAGASVSFRALPLNPHGRPLGALVLLQDVTELRRRDRALMSKDATIREIHHRVKNNLQTVAALLRLQARRVAIPEARTALEESMRRITSIALVHETLSVAPDERVAFDEVVDRLMDMLSDVMGSTDRVRMLRLGELGELPAEIATALVLVLTELVQNAVEHAFGTPTGRSDQVEVAAERQPITPLGRDGGGGVELTVRVRDNGIGLPAGFSIERSDRLGLQIVRTLVSAELSGTLSLGARADGQPGAEAVVRIPLQAATP